MPELPLILLPGLLNTDRLWAHQVETLGKDREVRVLETTVADNLIDLAEHVLAEAPEEFALAGLSMGGYVAFEVWRRAPERVRKLALVDTSARPDEPEQTKKRRQIVQIAREVGINDALGRLHPTFVAPQHVNDAALKNTVFEMGRKTGALKFQRQQNAIMSRPDSRPDLETITVPTLVIVGEDDQLTPPEVAEEIAAGIPGAKLVRIPDAGHLSPLENPEAVTAALKAWLEA